ncbi:MAG: murein biosynthesis integral membrane protein MurJ [Thermodesulfobacteriota bacterium]|nr:MAG: murein biosynthesis integral membrane protein MurJ [Thermodesulfobacteriota bacterium]
MSGKNHESNITGAASVVGAATILSRILGYLRDVTIAYFFGAGLLSDAFFVAFRISNLLRRLVGEGALTSSFIPVFTEERMKRSEGDTRDLVSSLFTLFAIILIVTSLLGILFSPWLVSFLSPGFLAEPEKYSLTVSLTRLMFPYIFFIGLMALGMGVLNTLKHFAAPAFAPVFFNLAIIVSILALAPFLEKPVYALAVGVLVGGALQFLILVPFLRKYGFSLKPLFFFRDPAIRKIFALMGPAAFGVGIYQLNIFVTLWFASRLSEGSVSYLYYAGRLMELPLGIFAVSVSTAVLPSLAEYAALKEWVNFKKSLSFALRLVIFVTVPATVGLLILSLPIIDVLFTHGEFTSKAASATSLALYYYAPGLVPVALYRILTSVFYSMKDTVTPVITAFCSFLVNIIMCLLLVGPLQHAGLALATTIAATFNMVLLFIILKRRLGRFDGRFILGSAVKNILAALAMGVLIYLILIFTGYGGLSSGGRVLFLGIILPVGAFAYFLISWLQKAPELSFFKDFLKKRRHGRA